MIFLFYIHTIISILSLNWTVFTSNEGGFTILTPGELQYQTKQISTSSGEISLHNYSYQEKDSSEYVFLYSITHYDLQVNEIHPDSMDLVTDLFDETLQSIGDRIYGEVLYSQDENFQNHPSRISKIKYNEGNNSLKSKMILTKNTMYLIEVFSVYNSGADFKVKKFMDSFRLL